MLVRMEQRRGAERRRLRRARILLLACLPVVLSGVAFAPVGGSEDDFIAGSGRADARVFQFGPTAAQLSLAPTFGVSLADYIGTIGRGESIVFDWVALNDTVPEGFRSQFPSVRADSDEEGGEEGTRTRKYGSSEDAPFGGGLIEQFARATDAPRGVSSFRLAVMQAPGVEVSGGFARTSSGIVEPGLRESRAVTEITRLELDGGTVVLYGLRWESLQRTGTEELVRGSFSVGGAEIGGQPVPVPATGEPLEALLGPVNEALQPTGLILDPPSVETDGGVARVTPLGIRIAESPMGREYVGPATGQVQPVREPIAEALIEWSDGGFSSLILVADIALGVVTGASTLHINLGGTFAFTEGEVFESPLGAFSPPAVLPQAITRMEAEPGRPAVPGTAGSAGVEPRQHELLTAAPQTSTRDTVPGTRGGVAVLAGLLGLMLAGGLAGADYLRVRQAEGVPGA